MWHSQRLGSCCQATLCRLWRQQQHCSNILATHAPLETVSVRCSNITAITYVGIPALNCTKHPIRIRGCPLRTVAAPSSALPRRLSQFQGRTAVRQRLQRRPHCWSARHLTSSQQRHDYPKQRTGELGNAVSQSRSSCATSRDRGVMATGVLPAPRSISDALQCHGSGSVGRYILQA